MPNNIELIQAYAPALAGVYTMASKSAVLDSDETLVRPGLNANELMIPELTTSGLADYSRNECYVQGDINLTWVSRAYDYDRGRKFKLDAMDAQESGLSMQSNGQVLMSAQTQTDYLNVVSNFIRTEVVPETDAYRFAKYAAAAVASSNSETATYTSYDTMYDRIVALSAQMTAAGVPMEGRYCFIRPTLNYLPSSDRVPLAQTGLFQEVVDVPDNRFYSAIDLLDGTTTGEEAGGYRMAQSGGAQLNFLIVHKPAIIQHIKHNVNKVIDPVANQTCDGWLFFYRLYQMATDRPGFDAGIFASILG